MASDKGHISSGTRITFVLTRLRGKILEVIMRDTAVIRTAGAEIFQQHLANSRLLIGLFMEGLSHSHAGMTPYLHRLGTAVGDSLNRFKHTCTRAKLRLCIPLDADTFDALQGIEILDEQGMILPTPPRFGPNYENPSYPKIDEPCYTYTPVGGPVYYPDTVLRYGTTFIAASAAPLGCKATATVTPAVTNALMPASYLKKASQAPGYTGTPDASPPTSPLAAAAGTALATHAAKGKLAKSYLQDRADLDEELADLLAETELSETEMEE